MKYGIYYYWHALVIKLWGGCKTMGWLQMGDMTHEDEADRPIRTAGDPRAVCQQIRCRKRSEIVELFGTLEWGGSFDYKEARRARDRKLGLID